MAQLEQSITAWLRNEACNELEKVVRDYCGDGKINLEYKTFPDQKVGNKAIKRVFFYDNKGNITGTNVSVVEWTQALEDETAPPLSSLFLSHEEVQDGRGSGTIVARLCAVGGTAPYSFAITADPSAKFTIQNGDELALTDDVDIVDVSYFVTIQVTDALLNTTSEIFEILVVTQSATGTFQFSGLSKEGKITEVALDDTAWVQIFAAPLADRNSIAVQNISGNGATVLWNYVNTAPATEGWRIEDGGFKAVAIQDNISVYARILSGTGTVAVDEVA